MNGILPLWKPKGMTSHDCVMKIRKLFQIKKVGHTGTLDPEAEGVLPVCIGQATKIAPFLTDTKKTYLTEVKLGAATETEDNCGTVVETEQVINPPSQQEVENVLQLFRGSITQVPPMYSAIKVNGKKLYEYARANEYVERPKRETFIYQLNQLENNRHHDRFWLRVVCSKGTYIRTLCVDIGNCLGYPAHMSALYRTGTGAINKENTVTFGGIEQALKVNKADQLLLSISSCLTHMQRTYVDGPTGKRVLHGQKLAKPDNLPEKDPFLVMYENQVIAVYKTHPENKTIMKPVRVFNDD
ncbi:tRNA pseudouridine(55) synthase TruB [Lentibacillus sp. CBA3610]|uniref:tRNA pseudouridine(55) synthase TruB n=1 Tax=Lentibacillus sp. CBA3610 TaxID=2518176 RepID=UPI001595578B|nr:tRNA pseudouridine(55) synthase TruB [Lentibacillus sp. CBA3610]QKY69066.1 tRNA pseudouridine(55) synthase TruB [Lentibacillus sp. CBA3610]